MKPFFHFQIHPSSLLTLKGRTDQNHLVELPLLPLLLLVRILRGRTDLDRRIKDRLKLALRTRIRIRLLPLRIRIKTRLLPLPKDDRETYMRRMRLRKWMLLPCLPRNLQRLHLLPLPLDQSLLPNS